MSYCVESVAVIGSCEGISRHLWFKLLLQAAETSRRLTWFELLLRAAETLRLHVVLNC